jgi:hypothetical protein
LWDGQEQVCSGETSVLCDTLSDCGAGLSQCSLSEATCLDDGLLSCDALDGETPYFGTSESCVLQLGCSWTNDCSVADYSSASTTVEILSGTCAVSALFSQIGVSSVGYSPTYTKGDLQPIVVDGIGTAAAEFVRDIELIVIGFVLLGIVMLVKGIKRW